MAVVSSSTAFSYSHWNAFVNDEMKIVMGCKQQLVDQSTQDVNFSNKCQENFLFFRGQDDLQCIIFTGELVGFTDISESSQEFVEASTFTNVKSSFEYFPMTLIDILFQYHAELFHLIREKFSPEAFARIMDTNPLFIETVNQLLLSIKPLTFA